MLLGPAAAWYGPGAVVVALLLQVGRSLLRSKLPSPFVNLSLLFAGAGYYCRGVRQRQR